MHTRPLFVNLIIKGKQHFHIMGKADLRTPNRYINGCCNMWKNRDSRFPEMLMKNG